MNPGSAEAAQKRKTFFRILFSETEGYVCIARRKPGTRTFDEEYFLYPEQLESMSEHINRYAISFDLYYCPQLFVSTKRSKANVKICPSAWADLDHCDPNKLLVEPTVTLETSPNRYQAVWVFKEPLDPIVAEDISRRIAYFHSDDGADKSGWDLTQLLRVPFSLNHKYAGTGTTTPTVKIIKTGSTDHGIEEFESYPEAEGHEYANIPFPEKLPKESPDNILEKHRLKIPPQAWILYQDIPKTDWSKALWSLEMLLYEAGLTREEVFTVVGAAKCNKYKRDGRSEQLLWKDVCRAESKHKERSEGVPPAPSEIIQLDALLTDEERKFVKANPSIVEEYIEWGKTLGDAAWQYHQAGAFIILSTLLAGTVRLPTSYGMVIPNLWFMILADTTLTRKTTAMDIAMDLLMEIDQDCVLATDGSIEGLMTSLSTRPGKPSIFLRDEFSGLLEALTKKDYYAGMAEMLTKLYDGKFQKRVLRKEIIEVRDPILILFAGGIKSRTLEQLSYDHVSSGFLPRFVFITAESDISKLRPLGPPTEANITTRAAVMTKFVKMHKHYNQLQSITVDGKTTNQKRLWDARLTPDAWSRYNSLETILLEAGLNSYQHEVLTPMLDRLAKSGLKSAVLLAAARTEDDIIEVTEADIVRAFYYVEHWRRHTIEVIQNIGKSRSEKQLERIFASIRRQPLINRSTIMQNHHLTARETDQILATLEQRGLITRNRQGRSERLSATEKI